MRRVTLLALLAIALFVATVAACDGDEAATSTPTASPSASPAATELVTPTPAWLNPTRGTPMQASVAGADPPLVATFIGERRVEGEFLLHNFIPATDGGPNEIDRLRVDGDSATLEASLHPDDLGDSYLDAWRNIAYPPITTGATLVIGVCSGQPGNCGGLAAPGPDARTTLHRTDDLGRTYSAFADLDGPYVPQGWSSDGGRVLLGDARQYGYFVWPEMVALRPPDGAQNTVPVLLPDGRVAWWMPSEGASSGPESLSWPDLVAEDGEVILSTLGATAESPSLVMTVLFDTDGSRAIVTWAGARYWTLYEGRGDGTYAQGDTILLPGETHGIPYTWLGEDQILFPVTRGLDDSGPMALNTETLEVYWLEIPPAPEGLSNAPYQPVAARPLEE